MPAITQESRNLLYHSALFSERSKIVFNRGCLNSCHIEENREKILNIKIDPEEFRIAKKQKKFNKCRYQNSVYWQ